jgi:hypothetical protein
MATKDPWHGAFVIKAIELLVYGFPNMITWRAINKRHPALRRGAIFGIGQPFSHPKHKYRVLL